MLFAFVEIWHSFNVGTIGVLYHRNCKREFGCIDDRLIPSEMLEDIRIRQTKPIDLDSKTK